MSEVEQYVRDRYVRAPHKYVKYRNTQTGYEADVMPYVKKQLSELEPRKRKIIDLGCGDTPYIDDFKEYIGVDVSDKLIDRHPFQGCQDSSFVVRNMVNVKYEEIEYNLVISILSLHYIENLDYLLRNVMRPKSDFLILIPNSKFDMYNGDVEDGVVHIIIEGLEFCYYLVSRKRLRKSLEPCEVDFETVGPMDEAGHRMYLLASGSWVK